MGTPLAPEKRIDGAYGEALRGGQWLADVIEVSGTISIDRREVPMAGSVNTGYKRGRASREGTLRFQKVDDRWEKEFMDYTSLSLAQRRAARNNKVPVGAPFYLTLTVDDPDAPGPSSYGLDGVVMWTMPFGYSITDMMDREVTITWTTEELLAGIDSIGLLDPI